MNELTTQRKIEIKDRLEKLSPGEWIEDDGQIGVGDIIPGEYSVYDSTEPYVAGWTSDPIQYGSHSGKYNADNDANFFVNAPKDISLLLDAVEQLESEIAYLKAMAVLQDFKGAKLTDGLIDVIKEKLKIGR